MRPSNKQRSRNKSGSSHNQRRSVGNIINRVFESAGPDGKVRGTPQQIIEKYQALGRDAQVSGDRVAAESFLQHSEHYSRMLGEAQQQMAEQRDGQDRGDNNQQRHDGQQGDQPGGQHQGDQQARQQYDQQPRQQYDQQPRHQSDQPRHQNDQQPRSQNDQPRQQNDQQSRQQGQPRRDEGRSDDRDQPRGDGYSGSGMATIDPGEGDDVAVGLIETPESRSRNQSSGDQQRGERRQDDEPARDSGARDSGRASRRASGSTGGTSGDRAPGNEPEPAAAEVNGSEHAAAGEEPRKAPARRSRPRRTSRSAEATDDAPAVPAVPVVE